MSFKSFSKLTIVSIFLIIVAGSLVRMTGSGMGCPDWPKCFGYLIPPTSLDQIEWGKGKAFFEGQMIIYDEQLWLANRNFVSSEIYNKENWVLYTKHDYAVFNPFHTWMEYINRLIGAISGLLTFIMFMMSFKYWNTKRKIVFLSGMTVFLMGFQAWLGATVVFSVLQPVQITIHMLMALVILALMVYLISEVPETYKENNIIFNKRLNQFLKIAIVLSLIQITLGTQVRQLIDVIASSLNHMQRNLWLDLAGITFKIHRSFAISIVLINAILFFINYKLKYRYQLVNFLCGVLFLEVLSGVILTYFDMLALMQPIHLIAASLLFLLQIALYFQLQKSKSN
tara:strand:+ start:1040 stop:2062 length:1023 start_codon:yes stop_codon:yes gene_type:complete